VIQDVINRTAEINSALGARASAVVQSSSDISHALLEQLKQLAEQGQGLPAALVDVSYQALGLEQQADLIGRWKGYWRCQDYRHREGCYLTGQIQQARCLRLGKYCAYNGTGDQALTI
jgi:hypothetical protein